MKFLFLLMAVPVMFVAQAGVMPDVFSEANVVQFYKDGEEFFVSESDQTRFDEIFVEAISGSRQMPAFAVAIHKLTMEDFKEGYWVKFDYGKTVSASGMDFDQLLIHIQPNSYGVNVIRGNNGKFDGRCYYLDLDNTLDEIYDFLTDVEHLEKDKIDVEIEKSEEKQTEIKESEEEKEPQPDNDISGSGNDGDKESQQNESTTNAQERVKEQNSDKNEKATDNVQKESQTLASESKIPSVNNERKEENKVINQEAIESAGTQTEIKKSEVETAMTETSDKRNEMPDQISEETEMTEEIETETKSTEKFETQNEQTEKVTASSKLIEMVSQWED